jgi:hypothetical protein
MADQTTYTGGTNQSSTSSTATPTLPSWLTDFNQTGANLALQAAQTNPYPSLGVRGVAGINQGTDGIVGALGGISSYQPQQVATGNVAQYAGGTGAGGLGIQGMDLSGYMNPYTQSVINQSNADINRQSAITQQQNNGQAARAGAFGGDRAAIVNTETQRNANDTMARTNAALQSQNFTQAQTAAQGDLARQLQAGTTQAQLAAQIGQGNQYAALQGQNLNMSALGAMNGIYTAEQATRQRANDAQYEYGQQNAMWPTTNAAWLLSQGQKLPYSSLTSTNQTTNSSGSSTGTATPPAPSTTAQLLGGLTAATGLVGAIGGTSGLSGGLSTIGNGLSSGYNYLTGAGTAAGTAADTFSGAGAAADAFSNAGGGIGDFADAAGNASSFDLSGAGSVFNGGFDSLFARGGIVGYAPGGDVQGDYDETYAPVDGGVGSDGRRYQANLANGSMQYTAPQGVLDALGIPPPEGADADAPDAVPDAAPEEVLPVPPIPPTGGAPRVSPATPINQPVRVAPAAAAPALTVRPMMQAGVPAPQPDPGVQSDGKYNPAWMALLKAGGAMMASKSPFLGNAVGEGIGAGADAYQQGVGQQQRSAILQAQLGQKASYQNGQLANGQARIAGGQDRLAETSRLNDAKIESMQARAQAALQRAQTAGASDPKAAAIADLVAGGMTQADAYREISGLNIRQQVANTGATRAEQGERRLDQTDDSLAQRQANFDRKLEADQGYRATRGQQQANDAEDRQARSIMFNASQIGKTVSYSDALGQVRGNRQSAGPAPMPAGQGTAGLRAAAGTGGSAPGPVQQVATPQEAAALPPGTRFQGPDGLVRVRGGQ